MHAEVPVHFVGNHLNYTAASDIPYATLRLWTAPGGAWVGECGYYTGPISIDYMTARVVGGANCSTGVASKYELQFISCDLSGSCKRTEPVLLDFLAAAGCVDPPRFSCGDSEGSATGACCVGPMGGAPPVGGGFPAGVRSPEDAPALVPYGVAVTIPGSGPKGAEFRYFFGGGGGPGLPENSGFGKQLGQYWNHSFSQRIVPYPDESRVWLVAPSGSFREFTDLGLDNVYATRVPADEYRTLEWLGAGNGWILHGLNGTKTYFRADGLWDKTVDRNLKTTQGGYNSGRLSSVTYPDGRQLALAYTGGKLSSIQEVPVTGSGDSPRTWTYSWRTGTGSGPYTYTQNLQTIVLPGG